MSYLVLARKYRPQTFSDLVGQEQVSRTLRNALTTGRVAHAYLFSGPRGVGKTTAARLLAMSLSCLEEDVAKRPCGVCGNCQEIQSGQAVDVIEVDGASNRGINEIRDLRETVKYMPGKSRYKVYIIDEVHALTKDAFNALLKTLEEPPAHVVFIFATTETQKVLPTILSRCQRYDFRRIRVEDMAARLAQVMELEGLAAEPEALRLIARQAEGGMRDALSLLDQAIASCGAEAITVEEVCRSLGLIDLALVRRVLWACLDGQAAEALSALDDAYLRGYDFKDLALKILEQTRGLTLIKIDASNAEIMELSETDQIVFMTESQKYSLSTLNRHFDAWLKFQREMLYNSQPRWALEAQVIRMAELAPLMPTAELVERLERLLSQNPPPPRPRFDTGNGATTGSVPIPAPVTAPALVTTAEPVLTVESVPTPAPVATTAPAIGLVPAAEPVATMAPAPGLVPAAEPVATTDLFVVQPFSGEMDIFGGQQQQQEQGKPPSDWNQFYSQYAMQLTEASRILLRGAKVVTWTAQKVVLELVPGSSLGQTTRVSLEKSLIPCLEKAWGVRPELIVTQVDTRTQDCEYQETRLKEIAQSPEAQSLMARFPGKFTSFILATEPLVAVDIGNEVVDNGLETDVFLAVEEESYTDD